MVGYNINTCLVHIQTEGLKRKSQNIRGVFVPYLRSATNLIVANVIYSLAFKSYSIPKSVLWNTVAYDSH